MLWRAAQSERDALASLAVDRRVVIGAAMLISVPSSAVGWETPANISDGTAVGTAPEPNVNP